MTVIPNVQLNNGVEIPQLGFGVFLVKPEETFAAVTTALEIGYRHIDTAEMYHNERQVGEAIAASGIDRSEIFLTSKLNNDKLGFDAALVAFDETLGALGIEQIDLFLIHWPLATVRDFVETWRAMEQIYRDGRARAIGVSNFQVAHLQRLFDETDVIPVVNQIETHPYLTQSELIAFGESHGVATEAWSPLARGALLDDPTIGAIAERVGKTPAQTVLRWHIQRNSIIFPKSMSVDRLRANFEIFDFVLSDAEMAAIAALNRDERIGPDPDTFPPKPN